MQTPKTTTSKKYPPFIRSHKVIKSFARQEKVFPKIGLKNCEKAFDLGEEQEIGILFYLDQLRQLLANEAANQVDSSYNDGYGWVYDQYLTVKEQFRAAIKTITDGLESNPRTFISQKNNKTTLILPVDLTAFEKQFVQGQDLFFVLRGIREIAGTPALGYAGYGPLALTRMDSLFGAMNSFENVLNVNDLKVVFSGSGGKGLWDLATMSMRGVSSCQRWGNKHAKALAGSMVDPYAGIIYITNNKKSRRGLKMIRRSVVRFVVHKTSRKPAILIERVYPHDYNGGMTDVVTLMAFRHFIKTKTKDKFPIIYGENRDEAQKYFIPLTAPVSELILTSSSRGRTPNEELSFRDSKIQYSKSPKYQDVSKLFTR